VDPVLVLSKFRFGIHVQMGYNYDLPMCLLGETKHLVVNMSFVVSFTINVSHFYKIMCEPKKIDPKGTRRRPMFYQRSLSA
jgi:hypothetical protein